MGTVLLSENTGDIINKPWHSVLSGNAPIPKKKPAVTVKLMEEKEGKCVKNRPSSVGNLFTALLSADEFSAMTRTDVKVIESPQS